jgi:hypothetical protein
VVRGDFLLALILLVVQAIVVVVGNVVSFLAAMIPCAPLGSCNDGLGAFAGYLTLIVPAVSFVVTLILIIVLRTRHRTTWVVSLLGLLVAVFAPLVTLLLYGIAYNWLGRAV